MSMIRYVIAFVILALASPAVAQQYYSQNSIQQGCGGVTRGHAGYFVAPNILCDAGSSISGNLTSLGVTSTSLQAFGASTAALGKAGQQLTWGVSPTSGYGGLDLEAVNGGTALPFQIMVNGNVGLSISTSGIVTIPNLTNPITITGATLNNLTLTGNVIGTPIATGNWSFTGTPTLSNGASLSGTFSGNPTFTGAVTFSAAGTGLTVTNNTVLNGFTTLSGNLNVATASIGVQWTPLISGTRVSGIAPFYLAFLDEASTPFSNDFLVVCNVGLGSYSGGRNCFETDAFNSAPLPTGNTTSSYLISSQHYANNAAVSGGKRGSCILGTNTCTGSLWGMDSYAYLGNGGTGWAQLYSAEFDISADSNSAAAYKTGVLINLSPGDGTRGYLGDTALAFGSTSTVGWKTVIGMSQQTGTGILSATDTTLISFTPVVYSSVNNTLNAYYGVDWRAVTFTAGGCAYASPGYCVNPTGNAYSAGVTTTGIIQAQTATLSSVTINDGGAFATIPTLTVQAPPSGATATATVSSMGLSATPGNGFYAVVSNGTSGCSNGATVTVSGGTSSVAATGTITVAGGVVTSIAVANAGTYTVLPANPATLTGSGCSGALTATLTWGITGISVTGGSGYLLYPAPVIYPSSVIYQAPILTAVMSGSNATLALNPSGGGLSINGTAGVSCSGALTGSAVVTNGIVTHC